MLFEVRAEPPLVVDRSPAWANDCVEAFLADPRAPWRYLETVLDAAGRLYTARIDNPDGSRATWRVSPCAPPPGLAAEARGDSDAAAREAWSARLAIPWTALDFEPRPGATLRGNLYRIARGRSVSHLALSPTFRADPPDFHVPSAFVLLTLA